MSGEDTWVLIQTEKEFCIVLDTAVLFNEELNVGDRVFFFYTRNLRLEGTVRCIASDSDECHAEAKRLRRLQKKKEASFHADQPRKEKQRVKNLWLKPKDKKSSQLPSSKAAMLNAAAKARDREVGKDLLNDDASPSRSHKEAGETDDADSEMDSTLVMSDEDGDEDGERLNETPILFQRKNSSVSFGGTPPNSSTPKSKSSSSILKPSNTSASGSNSFRVPVRTSSPTTESVESPSTSKKKNPDKVKEKENELPKRILVPVQNIRRTNGFNSEKMFVHSSESDLATEVHESTGIYCSLNDYALADGSNTATAVARRLMDGVFTFEALSTCSVTGLPPRGKGKLAYQDPSNIKPYLCPKGVNAIVCRAIKLQKLKHFSKKKDASQIRAAMAIRLNEIQKKLREAAAADVQ